MKKQKTQIEMNNRREIQDIIKEFASKCWPLGARLEISYVCFNVFRGYEIYMSDIKTGQLIGVIRSATLREGLEQAYAILRKLKDLSVKTSSNVDRINPEGRAPKRRYEHG